MVGSRSVGTVACYFVSMCLSLALLVAPTFSRATVTLTVRGTDQNGTLLLPGHALSPGDQVTVEITARNASQPVLALGASATGYSSNGFRFNHGRTVESIFNAVCLAGPGCFGGLSNVGIARDLEETTTPAGVKVQFLNAVGSNPTRETGAIDPGLSGVPGDPQSRIVFDVLTAMVFEQQASIHIGSLVAFLDALVLAGGTFGIVNTVWVVPEPGTALLLGLGLIGLSAPRRHQARSGSVSNRSSAPKRPFDSISRTSKQNRVGGSS